jgi:hypothetical protein
MKAPCSSKKSKLGSDTFDFILFSESKVDIWRGCFYDSFIDSLPFTVSDQSSLQVAEGIVMAG